MKKFAKGLSKTKLFWIFIIGSIFGCYYEQLLNLVKHFIADGTIFWEIRRGVIYGPFSPIYGAGAVIMIYFLVRKKRLWWQTLLLGSFIGGAFEYGISFLQETFIGTVSWDYSSQLLNIDGRTTVPIMLIWGLLALFLTNFLYPLFSNLIEKIPYNIGNTVTIIMVVFMTLNMFVSWGALIRQTLRRRGYHPITYLGEIYDKVYPDEALAKYFPNMQVKR